MFVVLLHGKMRTEQTHAHGRRRTSPARQSALLPIRSTGARLILYHSNTHDSALAQSARQNFRYGFDLILLAKGFSLRLHFLTDLCEKSPLRRRKNRRANMSAQGSRLVPQILHMAKKVKCLTQKTQYVYDFYVHYTFLPLLTERGDLRVNTRKIQLRNTRKA